MTSGTGVDGFGVGATAGSGVRASRTGIGDKAGRVVAGGNGRSGIGVGLPRGVGFPGSDSSTSETPRWYCGVPVTPLLLFIRLSMAG